LLAKLFGTTWRPGAYYRAVWEPSPSAAGRHLAGPSYDPAAPLRAKACCLTAVPAAERLYGVAQSRRPAPSAAQRVVRIDTTDTATSDDLGVTSDEADEPRDVAIAVKAVGAGRVGFFGDAFCTPHTVGLLASFCRATGTLSKLSLVPGATVRIDGLRAKPEHNGQRGTVLRRQGDERWQVTRLAPRPT